MICGICGQWIMDGAPHSCSGIQILPFVSTQNTAQQLSTVKDIELILLELTAMRGLMEKLVAAQNARPADPVKAGLLEGTLTVLREIRDWCDAYPLDVFPELDMKAVRSMLGDDLISRFSAHNFRHVLNGIRDKVEAAIRAAEQEG